VEAGVSPVAVIVTDSPATKQVSGFTVTVPCPLLKGRLGPAETVFGTPWHDDESDMMGGGSVVVLVEERTLKEIGALAVSPWASRYMISHVAPAFACD
jgi:hypothetical protein